MLPLSEHDKAIFNILVRQQKSDLAVYLIAYSRANRLTMVRSSRPDVFCKEGVPESPF